MATPHICAEKGDFAPVVLMPGDPLRAKFIAEHFLQNARQVTNVRGMLGYTGTYGGVPVSVMGSGMGMPSMGIYSYELYTEYDVETILRIGSAGSYSERAKVLDVLLATAAYSESSFARVQGGWEEAMTYPTEHWNETLRASASRLQIPLLEGVVHSSDVFYRRTDPAQTPYWQVLRDEKGCLAVEMESFALFHNAKVTGKNAACLLTISDSFISHEETTSAQRETEFTHMMEIALGAVLER